MDFNEIISMALPIVYVLVGAALIWLVIELVMTARKTRKTIDEVHSQVKPTLEHIERITASLEPVAAKVDPLVERVSLTVDAANLEIMRIDQILEDVGDITDSVASAVDAVDAAANAPMDLVTNMAARVRKVFKPQRASDQSVALGKGKPAEVASPESFKTVIKESVRAAEEAVVEQRDHMAEQRAEREEKAAIKHAAAGKTSEAAANVADAVAAAATVGADSAAKYFSYDEVARAVNSAGESGPSSENATDKK